MATRQGNYRRVAQNDAEQLTTRNSRASSAAALSSNTSSSTSSRSSRSERISNKLHALAWVVASYALARYIHLFDTLWNDERISRPCLYVASSLYATNVVLILYLTVYLPYKFPTNTGDRTYITSASSCDFWDAYCPNVLPAIVTFGFMGSYLLCRACFPVWGFMSPFVLGTVGLGAFYGLHFVPVFGWI